MPGELAPTGSKAHLLLLRLLSQLNILICRMLEMVQVFTHEDAVHPIIYLYGEA